MLRNPSLHCINVKTLVFPVKQCGGTSVCFHIDTQHAGLDTKLMQTAHIVAQASPKQHYILSHHPHQEQVTKQCVILVVGLIIQESVTELYPTLTYNIDRCHFNIDTVSYG